jgi:hypothetical protein
MARDALVDEALNLIAALAQFSADELISKPSWGALNFRPLEPEIIAVQRIIQTIQPDDLKSVPDRLVEPFTRVLKEIASTFSAMSKFSISIENPKAALDGIMEKFQSQYSQLLREHYPILLSAALRGPDLTNFEQDLRGIRERTSEVLNENVSQAKQVAEILDTARSTVSTLAAESFVNEFSGLAKEQRKSAGKWLAATAILAAVTVGAAISAPFVMEHIASSSTEATATADGPSAWLIAQLITSKVILFGILIGATVWCGRMYRALKHQEAINSHRSRALETFRSFVSKAADNQTKDAVLLETTRSIFAITSPGYFGADEGGSDGAMKVVEILRSVSQSPSARA